MKYSMIAFIILFILSSLGCKKDCPKPIEPPVFINDSALNIIWKTPIGYGALSSYTCVYKNLAIFSINESSASFNDIIVGLDKTTGKEVWRVNKTFYLPSYFQQVGNLLILEGESQFYAVDMLSGSIVWEAKCPYNNMYKEFPISYVAGKLWGGWRCGDRYKGDSTILFSIDLMNGTLKRIHSWDSKQNDLYQIVFNRAAFWMHPAGDSMLILNSLSYNWNTNQTKGDMIVWNLSSDTSYFDIRGYSGWDGLLNPLVIGDDVILTDQWQYIHSMNLKTLKTNWKLELPDANKSNGLLYYHGGMLITSPSTNRDAITFIRAGNGTIKSTITGVDSYSGGYYFKENYLFWSGSFGIKKVDYTIPKLIWKFETPDYGHGYEFNEHMALDAPNDLIYITDYGNFYCFKINK